MKEDSSEMKNIYDNPKYKNVVKNTKEKLRQLILKYDDKEALAIISDNK